jgi:hypothetical protein
MCNDIFKRSKIQIVESDRVILDSGRVSDRVILDSGRVSDRLESDYFNFWIVSDQIRSYIKSFSIKSIQISDRFR